VQDGVEARRREERRDLRGADVHHQKLRALRHGLAAAVAEIVNHRDAVAALEQGLRRVAPR